MTDNIKNYKYDRAIDLIRRIKTEETHEREVDRHKAFDLAIETLEKQIPKKPIEDGYYDEACVCPNCGCSVINESDNDYRFEYCYHCGQALDWGN